MSLIQVSNLTFSYEGSYDPIFENVSFQMDTDWKLGFTGRNGRGKTTFLNLLMGKYEYNGHIQTSVEFEYFPYEVQDADDFAIDVIRQITPQAEDWQIMRELSLLEVDEDVLYRPFSTLSYGERTKTMLAGLFLRENCFLLIDEPTNHLDIGGREKLAQYLKRKRGFILVSHDRSFLDSCVDHILAINRTDIQVQKGNFSSWWQNKQMQDEFELAENEKLKKDIGRLKEAARRTSDWSDHVEKSKFGQTNSGSKIDRGFVGHKSAKMMQRAKNIEKRKQDMITEKSRLLKNIESSDALQLRPLEYRGERLLELRDISISYGGEPICQNISFHVNQGDRIVLHGRNGCGKSSILKLICGEKIAYTGLLTKPSQLLISYVPQNADFLKGNLSDYAREHGLEESLFKTVLRKLDFSRIQFEKNMEDFSGGQKKKVLIAASLCTSAHLYIWDEPLNFIDVISRMQIEELLLEFQPTLLFVEHDKAFCERIATKRISFT